MNLDDLKKPFAPELISWRVGATNKDKTAAIPLAYIDARDVMERLDEVCGIGNWQCTHPHANGKTSCRIGIKIGDEWVWKENGSGDSQVEAEKGAFSDSFKRAAVLWGIGRYLYDVANIWVDIVSYGKSYKIKNQNDPKLKKALDDAAKGIRVIPEQVSETPPAFTGDELLSLQGEIKEADINTIQTVKDKAKAAWGRMNKAQKDVITKAIKTRDFELDDIPKSFPSDSNVHMAG